MTSAAPHWGPCIFKTHSEKMGNPANDHPLKTNSVIAVLPYARTVMKLGQANALQTIQIVGEQSSQSPRHQIFASKKEKYRWEKRTEDHPAEIQRKLKQQFDRAQTRMLGERDCKRFVYQKREKFEDGEHFLWQSSDLGIETNYEIGVCFSKGDKESMEDRYNVSSFSLQIGSTSYPAQLFGVFDGHAGSHAAIYARDHIQRYLEVALQKINPETLSEQGIWNSLKIAFVEISCRIKDTSGTTATVILAVNDQLWIPNAGDSRAVLEIAGRAICLSEDADPNDARHADSCRKRGGEIVGGRLVLPCIRSRSLAMTRSLGDSPLYPAISPRPEIIVYPLSKIPRGSHIVLASDGLWNVASSRQIANAVFEHSEDGPFELAQNLDFSARLAKSKDDITTIVIKFA